MRLGGRWSPLLGVLDRERAHLARRLAAFGADRRVLAEVLRAEYVDKRPSWLHRRLERRAERVWRALDDGASLEEALLSRPGDFLGWEVGLARACAEARDPAPLLEAWALRLAQSADAKDAASNALVYPLMLLWTTGLIWLIVLWKVIPTFATLYTSLGAELPLPTRLVIMASNVVWNVGGPLLLISLVVGAGLALLHGVRPDLPLWPALADRIPLVGRHRRHADRALALALLAALLRDGLPPARALRLVSGALPSAASRRELAEEASRWSEGQGAGEGTPGRLLDVRTRRAVQRSLERSGGAEGLAALAASEAERAERTAERGVAAFEPAAVLLGGLLLGVTAVAVLLPGFELIGKVGP